VTSITHLNGDEVILVEKAWEVVWEDEIDSDSHDVASFMMKLLFRRLYGV
jgi:hypothetical protein